MKSDIGIRDDIRTEAVWPRLAPQSLRLSFDAAIQRASRLGIVKMHKDFGKNILEI
jgi:hypothetical protein